MPRDRRFDQTAIDALIADALAQQESDPLSALSFEPEPEPAPRRPTFRKVGLPIYAAGSALDLFGTHKGLTSGHGREVNPLYAGMSPGRLVATNAAITALIGLLGDRIAKKRPALDKAMTTTAGIVGGVRGGVGIHNLRVAKGR